MSLSILNNISSLMAENSLNATQASLQKTLQELSTGQRINSGADDAAGLAIANGLQANVTALTQSAQNATDGVGMLQVADGALSQVTTLLNRAVTLATESSTGTVTDSQRQALDAEYQSIQSEITQIGSNTTYNGQAVFTAGATNVFLSDGVDNSPITAQTGTLSAAGLLQGGGNQVLAANGAVSDGDNVTIGGTTYTFKTAAYMAAHQNGATAGAVNVAIDGNADPLTALQNTMANLAAAVDGGTGAGTAYQGGGGANADAVASASGNTITFELTAAGQTLGATNVVSTVGQGAEFGFLDGATFSASGSSDLLTAQDAQTALAAINTAIATVANNRGDLGAVINRLQAASNVMTTQQQNLTSAESGIMSADIGQVTANMSQYTILQQTGIAALQQSNQMQQSVLKLLQ
jgi:flagellin